MTQPLPAGRRPTFSVEVCDTGATRVVRVIGEVDIAMRQEFLDALTRACATGAPSVAVDLSGLTFIDASGLNAIVSTHNRMAREHDRVLEVRGTSGIVRRMFVVTGLAGLLADADAA
jgi:anti-anti-sigma factor